MSGEELGQNIREEVEELSLEEIADALIEELEKSYGKSPSIKPFGFAGGDWYIRKPLLDLITKAPCRTFVELFGGSGVMTMLVPRDMFKTIIYNDIDDLIVNFFKVLRERPRELQRRLILMPVSRKMFYEYKQLIKSGDIYKLDPVDRAAVWFYVIHNSMFGDGNWFAVGIKSNVATRYVRKVLALADIAKYWLDVVLEGRDFRAVIRAYDRPYTLFYCDPPHFTGKAMNRERYYRFSFTEKDMRDLLNILSSIKGKFILKLSYDNFEVDFISRWVAENRYNVKEIEHFKIMEKVVGKQRPRFKTVLIYNYDA